MHGVPAVPPPRDALDRADGRWLGLSLLGGALAVGVYLATNRYPASGAGLYLAIAEAILAHGYGLPESIPHYTADGVPFAYPPLAYYLLAVALDLGIDPFTLTRYLPGVFTVAYLVPAYLLGRDLLGSRPRGTGAALLVAFNPQILEWHISAGGVVRALAFLFALWGAVAGAGLFARRDRRWLPIALVAFACTVLTHPTYSLFFVVTYLVFWVGFDRSATGLAEGAAVGVGGLVAASPWLLSVTDAHGFETFFAAAGTHGGIGGGASSLLGGVSPWSGILLLGAAYLLVRREWVLPTWLVAAELLFEQPRFAYLVGSFVLVAVAIDLDRAWALLPARPDARRTAATALAALALLAGTGVVAAEMTGTDETTPEFLDDDDVEAMHWVERETDPDATFVVLGDAAEWFPYLTGRTILVSPWGAEWVSAETFDRHLRTFENVSACQTAACVERWSDRVGADPTYLYVPRGEHTIRGDGHVRSGALERSLAASGRYELAFENDGVAIYRATD